MPAGHGCRHAKVQQVHHWKAVDGLLKKRGFPCQFIDGEVARNRATGDVGSLRESNEFKAQQPTFRFPGVSGQCRIPGTAHVPAAAGTKA